MPDKPDSTINGEEQTDETIFNSDIGDDWGEAFQAEDFMFSPDEEASSEFFLEDDSFEEETSTELDISLSGDDEFVDQGISKGIPGLDKLSSLLGFLFALPLKHRIPALGLPIALILAIFFFFQNSPEETNNQQLAEQESAVDITQDVATVESGQGAVQLDTTQESPKDEEIILEAAEVIEKVRKRWGLPSFLISTFNEESKATALLSVDLTFVLLLNDEDVIPEEKELLVRETIYQFFNNHPSSDLHRFALSRGEMNRGLRAWVNKQLPDIPLSSIVFDRYQIL